MTVKVAFLALLVGICSVVAEYTQPTIWPQVQYTFIVHLCIAHRTGVDKSSYVFS